MLADPERDVIRKYGVEDAENEIAWPALYIIGRDRKVVRRMMLETYKERPLPTEIESVLANTALAN